jgi:hypothetical protein
MEGIFLKAKKGLHSTKWISSHNHNIEVEVKKTILRLVQPVSCLTRSKKKYIFEIKQFSERRFLCFLLNLKMLFGMH